MVIDIVLTYLEGHGGVESLVTTVAQNLSRRGHKVRVLFAYFPEHIEWLGSLPEKHFFGLKFLHKKEDATIEDFAKGYAEKLREIGLPEICIGIQPFTCAICYEAVYQEIGIRIPIISWLYQSTCFYDHPDALKYATDHIILSRSMEQDIRNYTVYAPIYYTGVPIKIKDTACISRPDKELALLYVGRLVNAEKHVDKILRSLAKLDGAWSLTIIGDGVDRGALDELSIELGIEEKIRWTGWQSEPWQQIKSASLLLLASENTSSILSAIEALARGIPVLTTHNEKVDELIHSGENGWFMNMEEDQCLITYIQDILEGRLQLPDGKKCRTSVMSFEEEKVCSQIEKILYEARARLTWNQLYEHMGHLWGK